MKIHSNLHVSQCVNLTVDRWPMSVKIMQVFVKLYYFFRQITTKTGTFFVISDKCDFVVIDICTFDLDILTKVFLE